MNKTELIGALVANAKCKFSQEKLATWDEGDLHVLQESLGTEEPAQAEAPAAAPNGLPAPVVPAMSAEIAAELAELRSMIKGLSANSEREKAELVSAIVANSHGAWSEADLMRHDLPKLQQVYGSYQPRDYSGNAGALRVNTPEDEELLMQWPVFSDRHGGGTVFEKKEG